MPIQVLNGQLLVVDGQLTTNPTCCCGGICCDCDGNCDDTINQAECEANGHTWKEAGACDDDPPPCTTGACCNAIDCTITSEDCCTNNGGTYQGDGTPCDPNPCTTPSCPCYFINPDDGLAYLTRVSNYSETVDCPPSETWLVFSDGSYIDSSCNPTTWLAPSHYISGTTSQHVLASETYDADCNLVQNFEDVPESAYCACYDDNARGDEGCGEPVVKPRDPSAYDCDSYCANPDHFISCAPLTFDHYTYEDPCIPV